MALRPLGYAAEPYRVPRLIGYFSSFNQVFLNWTPAVMLTRRPMNLGVVLIVVDYIRSSWFTWWICHPNMTISLMITWVQFTRRLLAQLIITDNSEKHIIK